VPTYDRPVNLVGDFYELLGELGARDPGLEIQRGVLSDRHSVYVVTIPLI
jgi:hypothetical protein